MIYSNLIQCLAMATIWDRTPKNYFLMFTLAIIGDKSGISQPDLKM